jgi:hypothetical protein
MALIFVQGLCGMSYGMKTKKNRIDWNKHLFFLLGLLISAVCEQEVEVMEVALGSVFPILLSSGVIWPVEGMPPIMRFLSNFTPLTHVVEAMRCIVSRGIVNYSLYLIFICCFFLAWTIVYFKVWLGFVVSSAWSCGFFALAAILFALRK